MLEKIRAFFIYSFYTKLDFIYKLTVILTKSYKIHYFGIDSKISLLDLIVKHRENVLEIDAEELDDFHFKYYSEEYGKN